MGAVVLDSSVVLGALDATDAHHSAAGEALVEYNRSGHQFVVPTSVLAEVLVGEANRRGGDVAVRHRAVVKMFGPTRVIDDDIALISARLRAKHRSLRLPDAFVLAVGIVDDADVVLTADKRWQKIDDRVVVLS